MNNLTQLQLSAMTLDELILYREELLYQRKYLQVLPVNDEIWQKQIEMQAQNDTGLKVE